MLSAGICIGNLDTGGMSKALWGEGGWITAWLIADQFQLHNLDEAQTLTVHQVKTHINNAAFFFFFSKSDSPISCRDSAFWPKCFFVFFFLEDFGGCLRDVHVPVDT